MIGYLRFALALVVVEGHLSSHFALGRSAVPVFYWLSGVVITASFNQNYRTSYQFLLGRAMRVFPVYWVVFGLSIAVFSMFGSEVYGMGMPSPRILFLELLGIVGNKSMTGNPSIIPQAFAVTGEIVCYLMVACGCFSSSRRSLLAVTLAMWFANGYFSNQDWARFYFSPLCAVVFFGLGSIAYWGGLRLPKGNNLAGELSYPVFLSHYVIGSVLVGYGVPHGWPLFFAALPPTLSLSWLLVVTVERPIEQYRKQLRSNHGN